MTSFILATLLSLGATVRWSQALAQLRKGTRGWSTSSYIPVRRKKSDVESTIETEHWIEGVGGVCALLVSADVNFAVSLRSKGRRVLLTLREVPPRWGGDCTDSQLGLGTSAEGTSL